MKLYELRKIKKMTQNEIASYLGVSQNTYSQYENGLRNIDIETLKKLSNFFNVSIDYLVSNNLNKIDDFEQSIYFELVNIGFLKKDEQLTDEHIKILSTILKPQVPYARFLLDNSKDIALDIVNNDNNTLNIINSSQKETNLLFSAYGGGVSTKNISNETLDKAKQTLDNIPKK